MVAFKANLKDFVAVKCCLSVQHPNLKICSVRGLSLVLAWKAATDLFQAADAKRGIVRRSRPALCDGCP